MLFFTPWRKNQEIEHSEYLPGAQQKKSTPKGAEYTDKNLQKWTVFQENHPQGFLYS